MRWQLKKKKQNKTKQKTEKRHPEVNTYTGSTTINISRITDCK